MHRMQPQTLGQAGEAAPTPESPPVESSGTTDNTALWIVGGIVGGIAGSIVIAAVAYRRGRRSFFEELTRREEAEIREASRWLGDELRAAKKRRKRRKGK